MDQKTLMELFRSVEGETKEPGDLQDTLDRIVNTAKKYFLADYCVLFPMNPITGKFLNVKPTSVGTLSKFIFNDSNRPREDGLSKYVLEKKVLYVNETNISSFKSDFTDQENIKSFVAFHLFTTARLNKPLAVIYLDYRKQHVFNEQFKSDLDSFIEFASSELQQTWFIRRYREIAKIGKEINENLENIDVMLKRIFMNIRGILDVSYYLSIAKYKEAINNVDLYYVENNGKNVESKKNFELGNSISSWVIENLVTKKIDDIDIEDWPESIEPLHIDGTEATEKSLIFVPIKLTNQPLGVISVQHPEPKHYDDEDVQVLELLANHIALALNNNRLLHDLLTLDNSGQLLTQKLDTGNNIVQEALEIIHNTTHADKTILYPFQKENNTYQPAISVGDFISQDSIKPLRTPNPNAIVHKVTLLKEPIYADDSKSIYSDLGKKYSNKNSFPAKEKINSTVAIPLRVSDDPIGALFINFRKHQIFDQAQQWLINSLSTYAAIAIRNSRQYQELHLRRLKELEDLREIDHEISKSLESEQVLRTILEKTTNYIKADSGVIVLLNNKTKTLEAKVAIGEDLPPLKKLDYSLDESGGILKAAFDRRKTIRIANVKKDSEWKNRYKAISTKTISEMDVPLILEDNAIGAMNFESSKEAAFDEDDQIFTETLAGQAVIAIKNAIEFERSQRVAKELEALIEIVKVLLSKTEQKDIFSIILNKAFEITGTSKGAIHACNEDRQEIEIVVANGILGDYALNGIQRFDEGILGKVAREKHYIKVDNISNHPLRDIYISAFGNVMESELAVPILEGNKITGIINLENENPYHFGADDIEIVKSLASLCAVSLKTIQTIHEKELASVGTITGDISHKMNSPLAKIKKHVEFIELGCEDELKNPYLAEKISQIDQITTETIQMVQKTMEQAKRSFAALEKISLRAALKKVLGEIEIPSNIALEDQISKSEDPLEVLATPELGSVFHNLITNAIRFMPNGGTIYIEVEEVDESEVIISVEDTGKGIPEGDAHLVYLPLSDKGEEGHGFGLSLTKAYVEMIGGIIDVPVLGRLGKGTKFILRLKRFRP